MAYFAIHHIKFHGIIMFFFIIYISYNLHLIRFFPIYPHSGIHVYQQIKKNWHSVKCIRKLLHIEDNIERQKLRGTSSNIFSVNILTQFCYLHFFYSHNKMHAKQMPYKQVIHTPYH